jgi:hypothetical protein
MKKILQGKISLSQKVLRVTPGIGLWRWPGNIGPQALGLPQCQGARLVHRWVPDAGRDRGRGVWADSGKEAQSPPWEIRHSFSGRGVCHLGLCSWYQKSWNTRETCKYLLWQSGGPEGSRGCQNNVPIGSPMSGGVKWHLHQACCGTLLDPRAHSGERQWNSWQALNLHLMGLKDSPLCRKCGVGDETSAHILCRCEALASIRHAYLGSFFFEPEDIKHQNLGAIWRFKAAGLPWGNAWGTKGQLKA